MRKAKICFIKNTEDEKITLSIPITDIDKLNEALNDEKEQFMWIVNGKYKNYILNKRYIQYIEISEEE